MLTISERLEEPFGPYNVVDYLHTRRGSRTSLTLTSVLFRQGNEPIGLDVVDNRRLRGRGPVLFMGTLRLTGANKKCLSEGGERRLLDDLSHRLGKVYRQYFNSPDFAAKINVCGELFAEPRGLESSSVFTIVSHDASTKEEHEFIVRSLHVQSYARSRVYLSKWSTFREIISLVRQNERTPIEARTPRWLVTKYLEANVEHFRANNENPSLTPRHVHRSEVYNMFGRHCRWLSDKLSKDRLLNRVAWERFVHEAESRWNNLRPPGQDRNPDDCNQLDELWTEEDEVMSDDDEQPAPDTPIEPDFDSLAEPDYQDTYRQVGERQGSRELSPEHTHSEEQKTKMLTDPAVLAAVPKLLHFQQPIFPAASEWHCPVDSCSHVVVLREAFGKNFEWMDEDDRNFLRSQRWGPTSSRAIELFHDIVENHFYDHLGMAGIRHVACRCIGEDVRGHPRFQFVELKGPRQIKPEYTGFKFEWVKPNNHKPAFHHLHDQDSRYVSSL